MHNTALSGEQAGESSSEVSATADVSESGRPVIELSGLTKSFGPVRALRGVDLSVAHGEIVALLGPNGAGKSTATEIVVGLQQPDQGRAAVFGSEPTQAVAAGRVGAMLQAGALLSDARVGELLRLMHGLFPDPLSLDEVIERADLGSFLRTKTDKLSGGQAQRVRFAVAIMPDPDLLILDEPTVAMDVEIRRRFWQTMRATAAEGRTVLFTTHYLDEVDQVADRVVVLADGRVVADGTSTEIKSQVAGRTISLARDSIEVGLRDELADLPGVLRTEESGARLLLHSTDSDLALRCLLRSFPTVSEIEISSADLEDAFLALTQGTDPEPAQNGPVQNGAV